MPVGIKHVFFSGITGKIGQVIAKQLIADKFELTAILRKGHGTKHSEILQQLGVKNFVQAEGREEIIQKTKGADAIISTVAGDERAFIEYQSDLLAAAKANNVKLFIPSEFGSDIETIGANPGFFGYKVGFDHELAKSGVPYTSVQCGNFYDFGLSPLFHLDFINAKVTILGDGNVPLRRTAMRDIAKAVSLILKHPNPPKRAYIASEVMTERQTVEVFEEVFGRKFEVISKTKEQFHQDADKATVVRPDKFSFWVHGIVDVVASHEVNLQIPGSQSIREYVQQLKALQQNK